VIKCAYISAWYGLSVASPPACPPATANAVRSAIPAKTSVHNIVTTVLTEVSVVPALVITLAVPVGITAVERSFDGFASVVSITIGTSNASASLRCRKADNAESDDKDRANKPSHLVILTEGHTTIDYHKL